MNAPNLSPSIALKEWAVAVRALAGGQQIVMLRKGGIAEETRDFRVQSSSFYLFPTYEHQRRELLKPEHQGGIDAVMDGWTKEQATARIDCFAEVTDDLELLQEDKLPRLAPYHIWTDSFAEERLRWKRKQPLHVLIVRAYRLAEPVEIPVKPEYSGCKSWIEVEPPIAAGQLIPAVADEPFAQLRSRIIGIVENNG